MLLALVTYWLGYDDSTDRPQVLRQLGNDHADSGTLAEIWARGCRFLVAGRQVDGNFRATLDETPVPQGFQPLFQAIPEAQFRADISSTELRTRG